MRGVSGGPGLVRRLGTGDANWFTSIQGTTAAVIYADDSDHIGFASAAPQVRAKFAELLQQYALLVVVIVALGFWCMHGFGSRSNY